MPTRIAPRPVPEIKHVLHRVYQTGEQTHQHEVAEKEAAHAHAASISTSSGPHHRYEVRAIPSHVPKNEKGVASLVPNTEGRYEVVVALYQGGKQIPIT